MKNLSNYFLTKSIGIANEHIIGMNTIYDINSENYSYKNFSYFYKIRIDLNIFKENPSIIIKGIGILIDNIDDEYFMIFDHKDSFMIKDLNIPITNLLEKATNEPNNFEKTLDGLKIQLEAEIDALIIKMNEYIVINEYKFRKIYSKIIEIDQKL